jgi:NifU-like protein involved in Fe-S cluster formation
MASAARLYSPEVLGLATGLAAWPFDAAMPLQGQARSASCGSTLALSLAMASDGTITAIGCPSGPPSAAIFAAAVPGLTPGDIDRAAAAIAAWLQGDAPLPDWPGLAAIAPAAAYPARHGAIMLAWKAALDALSTA